MELYNLLTATEKFEMWVAVAGVLVATTLLAYAIRSLQDRHDAATVARMQEEVDYHNQVTAPYLRERYTTAQLTELEHSNWK